MKIPNGVHRFGRLRPNGRAHQCVLLSRVNFFDIPTLGAILADGQLLRIELRERHVLRQRDASDPKFCCFAVQALLHVHGDRGRALICKNSNPLPSL